MNASEDLREAVQALARRTRILRLQEREQALVVFIDGTPKCSGYRKMWEEELATVRKLLAEMGDLS